MTAAQIPFPTFAADPPARTATAEFVRLCPWRVGFILFAVATLLGTLDVWLMYAVAAANDKPRLAVLAAVSFPSWYVTVPLVPAALKVADAFPLAPGRWRRSLLVHIPASVAFVVIQLALSSWLSDFVLAPRLVARAELPPTFGDFGANMGRLMSMYFTTFIAFYWLIVGAHHTFFYLRRAVERDRQASELALHASRLEAGLAQANLRALNMQLQPHFLFNTLNAISVLAAKGERAQTVRLIGRMSDLLRMSLENSEQTLPLVRELEFAQRYLDIEQVRFADRMTVRFDLAPDTMAALVPSMVLQPLVENAVKHGIARRRAAGRIEVRARRLDDRLELAVRDDGPGFDVAPAAGRTGVGLANTQARLEQLYGRGGFEMYRGNGPGGGALVRIIIPFRLAPPSEEDGSNVISAEAV
ncbi:sensor histidine kinase [Longimicrobium sp.]|uniref:sensor histidine kinase n=1 Tax=Longimicrobium sp. TaxID=2029185 RepID=UPI003B3B1151